MSSAQPGKVYEPAQVETRWYRAWQERGYFQPRESTDAQPFTIAIPPPNVTGILHIGHVLNGTIQDVLVRRARMQGRPTLWIPGTDHASIATEAKIVQKLRKQGLTKHDLGREKYLEEAWAWTEEYGGTIIEQLQRLGCSCDWERTRFTMDEHYYGAVIETFVRLYDEGYIYRGERLINWDPEGRTALSDEEVNHKETQGHLWHFKYPLASGDGHLVVATTRPETMLGDTAVAVHPGDDRYSKWVGQKVILPLVGREIPIVADEFVDPAFGTGAVKVTPAHDANDNEMGQRHDLEVINIFHPDATLNENVPAAYRGLDRFVARKRVVADMETAGLLEKVEDHVHNVGYSERTDAMVEPYLSMQWFMRMPELAAEALKPVESGEIKFYPDRWVKVYRHWMTNIRDWCISRQLWWGHRIPVWYGPDEEIFVGRNEAEALAKAREHYGKADVILEQDPDVLDTWFSSWLWPFATLGWPDTDKPDLARFYPTQDLVTAPEILFFWVARMIMAGQKFMGKVPFTTVYFTGIVRDGQGRRMSKSLGNSPDPIDLIDQYGADALRTGLMLIAPQGQDIIFSEKSLELGRNYMNKIWNAARFVQMNLQADSATGLDSIAEDDLDIVDRWILSRLQETLEGVDAAYDKYRLNEVARLTYELVWADYCDWYLELIKARLQGDDADTRRSAQVVVRHVLREMLRLLHPFAPFITEELWQQLKDGQEADLMVSLPPKSDPRRIDAQATADVGLLKEVVSAVRSARQEMGVPPAGECDLLIRGEVAVTRRLEPLAGYVKRLAKVGRLEMGPDVEKPPHSATAVVQGLELFIPLEGIIDIDKERKRLAKKMEEMRGRLSAVQAKLGNENFTSRAPEEVVSGMREKEANYAESLQKLQDNHEALI